MTEQEFLDGQWLPCTSSNVTGARYEREHELLFVSYSNGSEYQYLGINEIYAIDFYHAPSKGSWIWTNIRVRGTKDGTQFGFIKQ